MKLKIKDWKVTLVRSTFAYDEYELPKDTCSFIKLFIVSLLVLPVSWITHLSNILTRSFNFHYIIGLSLYCLGCVSFMASLTSPTSALVHMNFLADICASYNNVLVAFIAFPIFGILTALFILIMVLFINGLSYIVSAISKIIKSFNSGKPGDQTDKNGSSMHSLYKSFKDKYCEKIDYLK